MIDFEEKEDIWRRKRHGKITSSTLPNLMQKGRGFEFGKQALREMYFIQYERRTGITRESITAKSMEKGRESEPLAMEWIRSQFLNDIKSCSDDFDEIIFNEPIEGFGDSPDFYMYDFDGNIEAVGEIKCPTDQAKIEELRELRSVNESQEYYWQLLGHFIGTPEAKRQLFVIYDSYANEGQIIEMNRSDYEKDIQKLKDRIVQVNEYINQQI